MGVPVVVDHATGEVKSIVRLTENIDERFQEVPVHPIEQSCLYNVIDDTESD